MFEHGQMSAPTVLEPRDLQLRQLQERIRGMQDGVPRIPVITHPALADLLQLRTGGAYEVDSASLAMLLLATPSQEGAWSAVVGAADFGIEAAAELGVDLTRTVLVPDPGEHWLEATAALVDVVSLVLLRPPGDVTARAASRMDARLRKRASTLIVWGRWPGSEARISLRSSSWSGVGEGHGRLTSRRAVIAVQRGSAPARETELWLPAAEGPVRRVRAAADARAALG
ncbi:MAG: hypothetical protein JWP74_3594 [Marmoricola sp.]|nr:hypothetical protein [Marmoricola sp.]